MAPLKELVNNNSRRSCVSINGTNGYFQTTFRRGSKVYIFNVSRVIHNNDIVKVEYRFNTSSNLLECFVESNSDSESFVINWVESDKYRRSNV